MFLIGQTYSHGKDTKSGTKLIDTAETLDKAKAKIISQLGSMEFLDISWIKRDNRHRMYSSLLPTCWVIYPLPFSHVVVPDGFMGDLKQCKEYLTKRVNPVDEMTFEDSAGGTVLILFKGKSSEYSIRKIKCP